MYELTNRFRIKWIICHFVTIWTYHATHYEFSLMISFCPIHLVAIVHLMYLFLISIPKLFLLWFSLWEMLNNRLVFFGQVRRGVCDSERMTEREGSMGRS